MCLSFLFALPYTHSLSVTLTKKRRKKKKIIIIIIIKNEAFNGQCSHHIETSQLICRANKLTGFYIMGTLAVKGLTQFIIIASNAYNYYC